MDKEASSEVQATSGVDMAAAVPPVEKLALADQIIDRLSDLLRRGALKPGDRLPSERKLCELLGVSRPSLRQALKALHVLGVVDVRPGAGVYVSGHMPRLMTNPLKFMLTVYGLREDELSEMRRIIEVALAGLAAERAREEDIRAVEDCLDQVRQHVDDLPKFLAADRRFHEAVFRAARNRAMEAVMLSVHGLLREPRYEAAGITHLDLPHGLAEHERILEAIKQRNPEAARRAMQEHIARVERQFDMGTKESDKLAEQEG